MSEPAAVSGPMLTRPDAPRAFHVMAKPTGAVCNLDCEYCFFLSKEMLYPGSRFRMAEDLQETYVRQLLEAHAEAPEVVVAWQGGEPTLMGLEFFCRSIELERRYADSVVDHPGGYGRHNDSDVRVRIGGQIGGHIIGQLEQQHIRIDQKHLPLSLRCAD